MLAYAMPTLGRMRVDAIQTPDVLACLERIWHTSALPPAASSNASMLSCNGQSKATAPTIR